MILFGLCTAKSITCYTTLHVSKLVPYILPSDHKTLFVCMYEFRLYVSVINFSVKLGHFQNILLNDTTQHCCWDSNLGPLGHKSYTLPTELQCTISKTLKSPFDFLRNHVKCIDRMANSVDTDLTAPRIRH